MWQRNIASERSQDAESHYAAEIFDKLAAMYGESWRTYHNMGHISSCLTYFDRCREVADYPDAIEMAIWFHDCIYVVGSEDNEALSRDWFLEVTDGHLEPLLRKAVDGLIMDTVHDGVPETQDGKLLADIDLTSFGLPWEEYMRDGDNVREEMALHQDDARKGGKYSFLDNLLSRQSVYFSDYYLENYEESAQANLRKHKELLASS